LNRRQQRKQRPIRGWVSVMVILWGAFGASPIVFVLQVEQRSTEGSEEDLNRRQQRKQRPIRG
jgi:hypothetical protein